MDYDLRQVPLLERKKFLRRLLDPGREIRFSDHQLERGKELFELARQNNLEGVVGKRVDSVYVQRPQSELGQVEGHENPGCGRGRLDRSPRQPHSLRLSASRPLPGQERCGSWGMPERAWTRRCAHSLMKELRNSRSTNVPSIKFLKPMSRPFWVEARAGGARAFYRLDPGAASARSGVPRSAQGRPAGRVPLGKRGRAARPAPAPALIRAPKLWARY